MQNMRRPASIRFRLASTVALIAGVGLVGAALAQDASANQEIAQGQKVFMDARCYACHGEYGFGGVGPRFRQDHFLGLSDYVIGQILVGRGVMPSFADALNNNQIAAVASYIRTNWGNKFGDVKPQEVAKVRSELTEKAPSGPHVSASQQPKGVPAPPSGGQPPGQPLPPSKM